ncbi:MAG: hypothetical protein RIG62_06215 [Cyclobacteriaceae bacterium]
MHYPASFFTTFLFLLFTIDISVAQVSGPVSLPQLGVEFTIPEGWVGQETEAGYVLGSYTQPGFVLLTTHSYTTLGQLEVEAKKGIVEQNGTQLQLLGSLEKLNANGIAGSYHGTLEGQPAQAYVIGLLNPHGSGVTIITATTQDQYSEQYPKLARTLAESFVFSPAKVLPIVNEWKQLLQNTRLTYMDSYYSSGPSSDGYSTGGGYSSEIVISLCDKGHFFYSSNGQMSVDTGGAFANSHNNDGGQGNWKVTGYGTQGAMLQLNFVNGEVYEYKLAYEDQKTYLNGQRYFRTDVNEKGLVCY